NFGSLIGEATAERINMKLVRHIRAKKFAKLKYAAVTWLKVYLADLR
ncbi:hypothetical protein MGSAQ_002525, partial [marine sediment metagenome]